MAASTGGSQQKVIDINVLGVEDLSNLQRQIDGDLSFFNESLSELRSVASKFGRCQVTVDSMNVDQKNQEALIPLSESVYIKAKIPNPDKYLVEIGTGYYIEMTQKQAKDHFQRKFAFVEAQIEAITKKVLPEKQQIRQTIVATLQKKIQSMQLETPKK